MRLISCNIEFEWVLAANGYTIVENEEASCHLVVPNKGPLRVTQPLQKYPGLFKSSQSWSPRLLALPGLRTGLAYCKATPIKIACADWFKRSRDFARVSNGTSAGLSEASSLTHINEIIRTGVITEIARVGLVLRPRSLLAAMALQMGFWLQDSEDRIGQCAECGNTWLIGPRTGHRVSRKYCSPNCSRRGAVPSQKEQSCDSNLILGATLLAKKTAAPELGAAVWQRRGLSTALPVDLPAHAHAGDVCAVVLVEAWREPSAIVAAGNPRLRHLELECRIVGQQPIQAEKPRFLRAAFRAAIDYIHGRGLVAKIQHVVAGGDLPGTPPHAADRPAATPDS